MVNFPALNTGGVENISFSLMRYSVKQGYRVIWLHKTPMIIADGFKEFVYKNVEMIPSRRCITGKWKHGEITFSENEQVTAISFTPFDMDNALKLCDEFPNITINPIYIVANTKGRYYFIEEYYYGFIRKKLYTPVQKLMKNWVDMDAVRFCAELQITSFENHYGLHVKDRDDKLIKEIDAPLNLDMHLLKKRAQREIFNIVSISRFDFPHKNYLLGLIKAYGKIKAQYPNLFLHIIGYGTGKELVDATINKLSADAQKGVILHGEVSKDNLPQILKDMHLNVSVAGSVGVGAVNGVLSIPARNFCEDACEVYGLLPEAANMTTSTEKGKAIIPFIEQVLHMSEDEYIKRCVDSYCFYANKAIDPDYIFRQEVNHKKTFINNHSLMNRIYAFRDVSYKLSTLLHWK